ncbi:MAG: sulfate permease [Bacteroidota bacterium]
MKLKDYIPILSWLPAYQRKELSNDVMAGLIVGIMFIPQGMAYAMLAEMPPIYGLYMGTVPLLLYAIFGTSKILEVGPVALVSLMTANAVSQMARPGSEEFLGLAALLALLVGGVLFLAGILRFGFLVNFLSQPVLSGFTSAAALIIGLSQLRHLLGLELPRTFYIHETIWQVLQQLDAINVPAFLIGIAAMAIIISVRRIHRSIPGSLIAVVGGILIVWSMELDVAIVGSVPDGLPAFAMPKLDMEQAKELLSVAFLIGLVGFLQSIAIGKALRPDGDRSVVRPNQELLAIGLVNMIGSFFQIYPAFGGFGRSAVNHQSGGKSGLSFVVTAIFITITLLFLTKLFFYLPTSVLAAIVMVAVFSLIDLKGALRFWKWNRTDFFTMMATFIATLSIGIEEGIGLGVLLSLVMVIYRISRPHIGVLGRVPNTGIFRNVERFSDVEVRPDVLIMRFDAQLYFANVPVFLAKLNEMIRAKGPELKHIILNAKVINYLDSSAILALENFLDEQKAEGRIVYFTGVLGPVRDAMVRSKLMKKIGSGNVFLSVNTAMSYIESDRQRKPHPHPYNFQRNS